MSLMKMVSRRPPSLQEPLIHPLAMLAGSFFQQPPYFPTTRPEWLRKIIEEINKESDSE